MGHFISLALHTAILKFQDGQLTRIYFVSIAQQINGESCTCAALLVRLDVHFVWQVMMMYLREEAVPSNLTLMTGLELAEASHTGFALFII